MTEQWRPGATAPDGVGVAEMADQRPELWRPMKTAPKDGTIVRLLVDYSGDGCHPLEDAEVTHTIGGCTDAHTGISEGWKFAGWSWEQDCFCEGRGKPIGWLPLAPTAGVAPAQACTACDGKGYFPQPAWADTIRGRQYCPACDGTGKAAAGVAPAAPADLLGKAMLLADGYAADALTDEDGSTDRARFRSREALVRFFASALGVAPARKITSVAEFCAEGQRLGLTAADLAEALKKRPEFADCLPDADGVPVAHPTQESKNG